MTVFDCETIPKPAEELLASIPPFNPEDVKYGNAKDPEKRAAILANAEVKHREDYIRDAALDPRTGHVKLAGFLDPVTDEINVYCWETDLAIALRVSAHFDSDSVRVGCFKDEKAFLAAVIMRITSILAEPGYVDRNAAGHVIGHVAEGSVIGYSIKDFDLPFLFKRAWLTGNPISARRFRRGRYWVDSIVDLRDLWTFGDKFEGSGGLNGLAKSLGLPGKTGDGKNFGALYAQDPVAAVQYLIDDLHCTAGVAKAMGEI